MNNSKKNNDCYEKAFNIVRKGVCLRKEHDRLFNGIRKLLPVDVVNKVDSFKHSNRGILLIGGDYNLLNMTVSYIWYRHQLRHYMFKDKIVKESDTGAVRPGIIEEDFNGQSCEDIRKALFSKKTGLLNNYCRYGRVLFLRNIHTENERILEQVGIAVQDFKESKGPERHKDLSGVSIWDPSIVIVRTTGPDKFPEDFVQNFEIIDLEPRKKKTTNKLRGTKKHYAPPEKRKKLIMKYLKEFPEEDRHVIASKVTRDLEKEGGRPLKISTLKKEISIYRKKGNGK